MMTASDRLQEALARVETGEPLEKVLTGLPGEDAELLRVAAAARSVSYTPRPAERLAAQRQALVEAARSRNASQQTGPAAAPVRRAPWAWAAALIGGLALITLCATAAASAGALWWWTSQNAPVAQAPGAAPRGPIAAATPIAAAPADPQTAILSEVTGLVEASRADGAWRPVQAGAALKAGDRVRTGALSAATLAFFDGSTARLGPQAELAVVALDARRAGPRIVQLRQTAGDSDHDVAKSADPDSIYEVATPSGVGRAKGTQFHVSISTALIVRFAVDEGAVAVTNVSVTVLVVAGQTTLIPAPDQPPAEPVFRLTGEGQVQQTGEVWIIAGQSLAVTPETRIVGDPQVDDWVAFEARLSPDGRRLADKITLLRRSLTNRFTFAGSVEAIGADAWTISGRLIRVDALTQVEPGLAVGDDVEVTGGIATDGTFWAASIRRLDTGAAGLPFAFTGVVESQGEPVWVISGISVTVNVSATVEAGLAVGDVVDVRGHIQADGAWLAESITRAVAGTFDFVGVVITTNPWNVSGVPLAVNAATQIDEGLVTGNRVRARGQVLADGTWLAASLVQLDDGNRHAIRFTAAVESIDPWVIGGVSVTVDARTRIIGAIAVDDLVTVKGNLQPDGVVLAKSITRVSGGNGCASFSAIVSAVTGDNLTLLNGQTIALTSAATVSGQVQVASIVVVTLCVDDAGQSSVVAIVVVFQLDALPPAPTPAPVTGCVTAVQVANGRILVPGATTLSLGGNTWLEIELRKKGDEVKLKINGQKPELKIKVKKRGEIEVRVEGRGSLAVTGAGDYPAGASLTVQMCVNADGTVVITVTTTTVTATPPPANGRVVICHIPAGNRGRRQTMTVDAAALQAHLNHGDTLGPCGGGGDDDDDDDDDDD